MKELTPVSVIIPTWNRAGLLRDCLAGFLARVPAVEGLEIVVVDDGSTDRTPEVVRSYRRDGDGSGVRYVRQDHRGLNAARNAGIRAAAGDVICFVDDDELVPPHYVVRVRELLGKRKDVAGVGGPCSDYGNSRVPTCARCSLAAADLPGTGRRLVERLLGGNMALRREVFEQVGLFDEELSGRGDESEWFHRARGLRFLYDPELWVWHRRDGLGLAALCCSAFRQGLALPRYREKVGVKDRPRLIQIGRYVGHAARRRCGRGLVLAAREAGAMTGYLRSKISLTNWLQGS